MYIGITQTQGTVIKLISAHNLIKPFSILFHLTDQ